MADADATVNDFRKRLLDWYGRHRRALPWRETTDPYRIWVSEVMLQQTQVGTAIGYYRRFTDRYPDVASLADADLQEVLKLWEGLGYYARARNLHRAARQVLSEHGGIVPCEMATFRRLPGVGDYIAAAVLSIACGQPHPVVDGNVKRVLARLFLITAPANRTASHAHFRAGAEALLDRRDPGAFNQAMMELGALICRPMQPLCNTCPVDRHCRALQQSRVGEFPRRLKKAPVPERHLAVGIVFKNRRVLITRRPPEGLLGGLWEFPGGLVQGGEPPDTACRREIGARVGLVVTVDERLARVRHAYTHFKIVMDVYLCRHRSGRVRRNGPADHRWVKLSELKRYPFPGAHHKFLPLLREERTIQAPHALSDR